MQTIQRPVADLNIEGMGSGHEAVKKRTSAIFLQLQEMCQGAQRDCAVNLAKKFAPEIKVPAQKNQICSLSLFKG